MENPLGLNAWGLVVEDVRPEGWDPDESDVGWHLLLRLIIERDKNAPIGPALYYVLGLDRQGLLMERPEEPGELVSAVWFPPMEPESPPEEVIKQEGDRLLRYVLPGLMAVSFMHCRNVTARTEEPEEKRSRSWQKKRGRPLTRYEVLEIAPMREVLDREGEARSKGLKHALHICRGHFKTFSEEAPLFGRVSGTFWWADQVRGSAKEGRVIKDYDVAAPQTDLGRPYEQADEEPELARSEQTGPDPDVAGRGLAAHNRTQNLLAAAVVEGGLRPRRPTPDEPKYDLAWAAADKVYVAEVKSITNQNEERQLRNALGQVLTYRYHLGGPEKVQAVIAVERRPTDEAVWLDLCNQQAVVLCWPEVFNLAVRVPEELS